jgi:glyoxylase-like metal-dependent hydrolase (beta-lactamase superfamily II)
MWPGRVRATRKLRERLWQPHLVLASHYDAFNGADVTIEKIGDVDHTVINVPDTFQPLRVFLDPATSLPVRVATVEDDPILGDTDVTADFGGFADAGGVMLPTTVTIAVNGLVIQDETRTGLATGAPLDSSLFDIPADLVHPAGDDPERGEREANHYERELGLNVDADAPAGNVDMTEIGGAGSRVWQVGADLQVGSKTLAIEGDTGIIVAEAPFDEERSLAVIGAIEAKFPGKPITHLIASHHHHDHAGGVRTYIAKTATIVVAEPAAGFINDIAFRPHTVKPDLQETEKKFAAVMPVVEKETLTDGKVVEVHRITSTHAESLMYVYIPDPGIIFVADIYSPGFASLEEPLPEGQNAGVLELYADAVEAKALPITLVVGVHGISATFDQFKQNAGK